MQIEAILKQVDSLYGANAEISFFPDGSGIIVPYPENIGEIKDFNSLVELERFLNEK